MKKLLCILFLIFLVGMTTIFAEETYVLENGKRIILFDDGTYNWDDSGEELILTILNVQDKKSSYGSDEWIEVEVSIENLGYGTLYDFSAKASAYDDRGQELEDYGFGNYIQTNDWNAIYIPLTKKATFELSFEGKSEFLSKIILHRIDPEDFNMRMLPENIDVNDLITVKSMIDNVEFVFDY